MRQKDTIPKNLAGVCYNIQFASRSGNELKTTLPSLWEAVTLIQPTPKRGIGAAEMIKEIVANIKTDELKILFRMDSGYFDEKIIETKELLGCK